MSNLVDLNPYGVYNDLQGRPLNNGKVYIGLPNQDPKGYPAQVFWDAAMTIPAAQPLRTVGGYVARNGTPARVYINGNYSLQVTTSTDVQVFYVQDYFLTGSAQVLTAPQVQLPFDSISALRANINPALKNAIVTSYYGGNAVMLQQPPLQGSYFVKTSDTTSADNGSTIIVDASGLRWYLSKSNTLSVMQGGAKNDKTTDDTAAIQSVINTAFAAGIGVVSFPSGLGYLCSSSLIFKNNTIYQGEGINLTSGGTLLYFTGTSDFVKVQNPINASTVANISVRDIYFYGATVTTNNGLFFDTGSTYLDFRRCRFYSSGTGVILDQSELVDFYDCQFLVASANAVGLWIVNGTDKNPGAQTFFTNRIGVHGGDFNGHANGIGIYDDGGTAHIFENINYNALKYHIVATSVNGLKISGGESELASASSIVLGLTKRNTNPGAQIPTVVIDSIYLYNNTSAPVLTVVSGAVNKLQFTNCPIITPANPISGWETCNSIVAYGNTQTGTDTSGRLLNNVIDLSIATTQWNASTTAPSLGNGTLTGTYSRNGKQITYNLSLAFGSTTTPGAGSYTFNLPFTASSASNTANGAAWILISGSSYYPAVAKVSADGTYVTLYVVNGNAVGAIVPAAFTSGSQLTFSISYVATSPI